MASLNTGQLSPNSPGTRTALLAKLEMERQTAVQQLVKQNSAVKAMEAQFVQEKAEQEAARVALVNEQEEVARLAEEHEAAKAKLENDRAELHASRENMEQTAATQQLTHATLLERLERDRSDATEEQKARQQAELAAVRAKEVALAREAEERQLALEKDVVALEEEHAAVARAATEQEAKRLALSVQQSEVHIEAAKQDQTRAALEKEMLELRAHRYVSRTQAICIIINVIIIIRKFCRGVWKSS